MFAKLLVIILVAGAIACALLVSRQQRIDIAHEMALAHQRLSAYEQTMWKLRGEMAARCRPEQLWQLVQDYGGDWQAIPAAPPRAIARPRVAASHSDPLENSRDRSG